MSGPRTIAVLHDSPDFGGHERAFLTWLPALIASPEIASLHIQFPLENHAFQEALQAFADPKLKLAPSPFSKKAAEPFRAPFRVSYGRQAVRFIQGAAADLVLMLQGRIENLATPMLWAPRSLEMVSYLPMAHSGAEMGRPPAAALITDGVKRFYYARPQRIITPSRAVAAQARRAGAMGSLHVVENTPPPAEALPRRAEARAALGLDRDARIALFLGRFDAQQKGIDRLLRDLRRDAAGLSGWTFLFVGSGPAEKDIRTALGETSLQGEVLGWTSRPELYLAAADLLLAPSRFEGVPLVMLEALRCGTPIVASDIDVYREYLPEFLLHDFSRPVDLAAALETSTSERSVLAFREHASTVCARLDLATSQRRFLDAVLGRPEDPGAAPVDMKRIAP